MRESGISYSHQAVRYILSTMCLITGSSYLLNYLMSAFCRHLSGHEWIPWHYRSSHKNPKFQISCFRQEKNAFLHLTQPHFLYPSNGISNTHPWWFSEWFGDETWQRMWNVYNHSTCIKTDPCYQGVLSQVVLTSHSITVMEKGSSSETQRPS